MIWKRAAAGPGSESSPVVVGRTVFFGCEDGNSTRSAPATGNTRWTTPLAGAIKSAPAYYDGILFVGDYGGYMNAVNASNGQIMWQSGSPGARLQRHRRVLLDPGGRLRPRLQRQQRRPRLQLRREDGELAWTYSTGGYVYSGPGRRRHPARRRPSTSAPSTATSTRSTRGPAALRWRSRPGGSVIGSLERVGNIVYVADLRGHNDHTAS